MTKQKIDKGDEVLVRGEAVWLEDDGYIRVQFRGYQYPITIHPDAIERVIKPKPAPRHGGLEKDGPALDSVTLKTKY